MNPFAPEPFGGFGFAIRTFWIVGKEFRVCRSWQREPSIGKGGPEFEIRLEGKAISQLDKVCIIGEKQRIGEFPITLHSDKNAKLDWDDLKGLRALVGKRDATTPEGRLMKRIDEELDKSPPTATLGRSGSDREIGLKETWYMECNVADQVLIQLEAEILKEQVSEVEIGIKWVAGLVEDEHAPQSFPTTWGLIRSKYGVESLNGYVTSINWKLSKANGAGHTPERG